MRNAIKWLKEDIRHTPVWKWIIVVIAWGLVIILIQKGYWFW